MQADQSILPGDRMARYNREITLQAEDAGCDRAGVPIVRGVSFTLKPGGALQLFGANGSGKTSLLSLFAGHIRAGAGSLRWRASSGAEQEFPFDDSVFFLGHQVSIKSSLTAEENLLFWSKLYCGDKSAIRDRVGVALDRVGMGDCGRLRAGRLSAGQRRRIDLARALLAQREVWLMDEPAAAIDADGVGILRGMISDHLGRGGIALIATHDELGVSSRKLEIGT